MIDYDDVPPSPLSWLRVTVVLFALTISLWLLGFVLFIADIEIYTEPPLPTNVENTDAIVVLTGGSERVNTGIMLLNVHLGKKLFITGVHQGLSLDNISNTQNIDPALRACCIVLGYAAESTVGNAEETQLWMALERYKSMRLVTANYHMPRSLLLFHAAMPDIKIIPYPVMPEGLQLNMWWQHPTTVALLVIEYTKYLVALAHVEFG